MLRYISSKKFILNLKTRKLENLSVIRLIEQSLKKQRGFIFRKPAGGESVILLLSGGLDSVTSWGILMKEFGLHVYPISFDRGEKRAYKEKASIDYFSAFYQHRFPHLYHAPFRITLGVQDMTIPIEQAMEYIHPEILMKNFTGSDRLIDINISFGSFLLLPLYAKIYAEFLRHTQNIDIRTIFCSVTLSDGLLVPHQTFTALRSIMFFLNAASGDYRWQFASAIFEKELGLYYDKSDLVLWADKHHIPLEHSWSCYHATTYQCGGSDCQTCVVRRYAFIQAKAPDKTIYRSLQEQSWQYRINRMYHSMSHRISRVKGWVRNT